MIAWRWPASRSCCWPTSHRAGRHGQIQILLLLRGCEWVVGSSSSHLGAAVEVADRIAVMYAGRIVEEVGGHACATTSPYTLALLRAGPAVPNKERLDFIAGSPPDLTALPAGCAFAERCRWAQTYRTTKPESDLVARRPRGALPARLKTPINRFVRSAAMTAPSPTYPRPAHAFMPYRRCLSARRPPSCPRRPGLWRGPPHHRLPWRRPARCLLMLDDADTPRPRMRQRSDAGARAS
jgi:oligopeptide/dipeptide ABC transporter ATP-binding protein